MKSLIISFHNNDERDKIYVKMKKKTENGLFENKIFRRQGFICPYVAYFEYMFVKVNKN